MRTGHPPAANSKYSRTIAPAFLAPEPLVEVRAAKAPASPDTAGIDFPTAGHLLKGVRMDSQKGGRFDGVEQRFEFRKRNSGLIAFSI